MSPRAKTLLIAAVIVATASACDFDPMRLSERPIAGVYRLKQWEDEKTYYLVGGGSSVHGEIPRHLPIVRIGWNSQYILADRRCYAAENMNGVIVIDVKAETVTGPYTEKELAAIPDVVGIRLMSPEVAWKKLRWKPPWAGA